MAMLGEGRSSEAKRDVDRSDSSPEVSSYASSQDAEAVGAVPSNPLKEVEDESVLCSACGKIVEVSRGPVLSDGYWFCHACHQGKKSASQTASSQIASGKEASKTKSPSANATADETWLSVRDHAVHQVGDSADTPQVEIDDEILKGITMRPSGKWQAQVYYAGKSRYIGVFETRQKAALAFKLVRSKLRPLKKKKRASGYSVKPPDPPSDGAVHSSFSNLFSKRYSAAKPPEKRVSSFTDKKPGREMPNYSSSLVPSGGQSGHRPKQYIDDERTRILLDTPLCKFYASMPLSEL
mmetsp:Transcript_8635/g.13738  ORF Transcript_8635/g.13738 Transcript_8635/m.13738 type:complete len:295 (-) Transcript_8635:159-1043(-)